MSIEILSTVFLAFALVHSFLTPVFAKLSKKFPADSIGESFFHLLAEVEVVFGFWAGIFLTVWAVIEGPSKVIDYQQSLNMTEPLFVFCIMILASTRPIVTIARTFLLSIVHVLSRIIPVDEKIIQIFVLLSFGPLLGSLITEPAAITILALLLYRMLDKADEKLLYGILALLFVNISIGGGLTHFAAPPILIVAQKFGWGLKEVFVNLGEAVICAVFVNALLFCLVFKNKISEQISKLEAEHYPMPWWVIILHVLLMVCVVMSSHYQNVFMSLFMAFIGLTTVTKKYQDGLKFKEAFLVGFFLAGLIIFGSMQKWWLTPILQVITDKALFFAATGLTAVTDNAALTYLGSQVESLSNSSKWALVSGAITGGGLTILANAPNPAGFSILASRFPNSSLNAVKLLLAAIVPTAIASLFFMLLGNF
ncbi:MAG: putative Na+/H+ antiporter [Pseudobdellovibrio sp.]|nr:putative Na+/H+ antiporter [Pseudobdellovibrio sp.]